MKTLLSGILITLLILTGCSSVRIPTEQINAITHKVQTADFTIRATHVYPLRGGLIYLDPGYTLKIHNDSVFAYLPYFGVAHSAPMGVDNGIKLNEPANDYQTTTDKKGNGWQIKFNANHNGQTYHFMLNITNGGNASFSVTPNSSDPISYTGDIITESVSL